MVVLAVLLGLLLLALLSYGLYKVGLGVGGGIWESVEGMGQQETWVALGLRGLQEARGTGRTWGTQGHGRARGVWVAWGGRGVPKGRGGRRGRKTSGRMETRGGCGVSGGSQGMWGGGGDVGSPSAAGGRVGVA